MPTASDLRERRKAAGLSQPELAVKAHVGVSTVVRAEQGKSVRPAILEALERALVATS